MSITKPWASETVQAGALRSRPGALSNQLRFSAAWSPPPLEKNAPEFMAGGHAHERGLCLEEVASPGSAAAATGAERATRRKAADDGDPKQRQMRPCKAGQRRLERLRSCLVILLVRLNGGCVGEGGPFCRPYPSKERAKGLLVS